jgi:nucleotidyltransferase/DNA polymerase involved in DNA repair
LDEAYLNITEKKTGWPKATRVARTIRAQIWSELTSCGFSRWVGFLASEG